jgi:UDP:flavonoid glycosyltransferase YjiC (YdhE family)
MRFLVCTGGGYGNLHPLIPLAQALADRGHAVAFAVSSNHLRTLETLGFDAFSVGPAGGVSAVTTPAFQEEVAQLDQGARASRIIGAFAAVARATVPDIAGVIERWLPDALLRDSTAWGAWIAGEQTDTPVALFDFAGLPPQLIAAVGGAPLEKLRTACGLPSDPSLATMYRWLVLVGSPPGWSDLDRLGPTAHLIRPPEFDRAPIEARPEWLDEFATGGPLIYATLGSVFGKSPKVWKAIFAAVADHPTRRVVATVGQSVSPASLGPVPANVRVEQYVPQSYLLDVADAVVGHAGYGTLMGALRRGLPIVTLPMPAADNLGHAARVSALGAGIVVPEDRRSPEVIGNALRRVLEQPSFREAARRLARGIAELPAMEAAARLLEELATKRRPITREPN